MSEMYNDVDEKIADLRKQLAEVAKERDIMSDALDDIHDALGITPYSKEVTGENALDAINRLKSENERLRKIGYDRAGGFFPTIEKLQNDHDRLKALCEEMALALEFAQNNCEAIALDEGEKHQILGLWSVVHKAKDALAKYRESWLWGSKNDS